MTDPLASTFSRSAVRVLADPASLLRGVTYAEEGRVEQLTASGGRLEGTVRGALPYEVALWVDGNGPAWSCTCPVGEDGTFCKHCVALALAREGEGEDEDWEDAANPGDEATLRAYVGGLDAERLAELLLEQSAGDWRLRERLLAEAAAATGTTVDLAAWRHRLEAEFATGDFVEYAEAASWAHDVDGVLNALAELLDLGHADAVVVLAEHAWRLAEGAIDRVDDSDGWLTGISAQLGELHHRACAEANVDPVALARRLVELELSSELDAFHRAAARYTDVLGDAGLAEYRRLIEPRFDALPAGDAFSVGCFRVTQAMVGVALASRDPDQLIAVKGRDLRTPDDYREVATVLAEAGRVTEAVEWAERGLAVFGDRSWQTPPLRELLADLHRRRGQPDAAVEVFWDGLLAAPSLESYRRLLREAEAVGDQDSWRERALEHLRGRLDTAPLGST
ncbi:MAG: SWIM zinc finger family protein, partial [Gaiellaceae bacterium]